MKLHDYIGGLVNSIQQARVSADLQAVRVAEDYAKHSLLEHFPVPRMRLKDVEMTIPVAINPNQMQKSTNYEPIDNREFNTLAYKETLASLGLKSLARAPSQQLRQVIAEQTDELEKAILKDGQTQAIRNFAFKVAKIGVDLGEANLTDAQKKERTAQISDRLNEQLRPAIKPINTNTLLGEIDVAIEADILREKPADSLVNIKLVIQEEGVEWHRLENESGKLTHKLIPE